MQSTGRLRARINFVPQLHCNTLPCPSWAISSHQYATQEIATSEHVFLSLPAMPCAVMTIVVDLSQPSEVLQVLLYWLDKVRKYA